MLKHRNAPWIISIFTVSILSLMASLTACDPAASYRLTDTDKRADMMWLFSIFRNNYAPLELKEKLGNFTVEQLEKEYMARAMRTETNAEFTRLMSQFVARFADAHTRLSVTPSNLPEQAEIAYVGISGVRDGEAFRVTKILPTIDTDTFLLKEGDRITHIDGEKVTAYIDRVLVPHRNLGDTVANHTLHMNNLFTRMSLSMPIPKDPDVKLTVDRDDKPVKITLPWIVRDLYDFRLDQALREAMDKDSKHLKVKDQKSGARFEIAFLDERGRSMHLSEYLRAIRQSNGNPLDTFMVHSPSAISIMPQAAPEEVEKPAPTGFEKLKLERKIPENAIAIEGAKTYPAYMYSLDVKDESGTVRGRKRVGVIRIDTFSPKQAEKKVVEELLQTLKLLKSAGVNSLIIDTIDNPGGSLRLLLLVSQAFSAKRIQMPTMQVALNDTWMNQFQKISLDREASDPIRESARRIYDQLAKEKAAGNRLSSAIPMESIMPFELDSIVGVSFPRVVMITSEMNASCGDIFPGILKTNKMAIIAGTKTMGAGGNVTQKMNDQAPNSKAKVSQTESLVVLPGGEYIENKGVTPDLPIDVNASLEEKYKPVYEEIERKLILPKESMPVLIQKIREREAASLAMGKACSQLFSKKD